MGSLGRSLPNDLIGNPPDPVRVRSASVGFGSRGWVRSLVRHMDPGEGQISIGARFAAAAALAVALVVVLIVLAGLLSNGDGGSSGGVPDNGTSSDGSGSRPISGPATYTIKEGDTLSAIADETGVSIARIEDLNPGLDPQAITPGQKIRLR